MDKKLFNTSSITAATATNSAGGKAYKLDTQVALAKYLCAGTFGGSVSSTAEMQLDRVLAMCEESDPQFIAQLAVYARQHGRMKDGPAVLTAYLARKDIGLCKQIFTRVINDGKMLRNFVQVMRSGVIKGSKSLGYAPRKLVRNYLASLTDEQLFRMNVGNDPTLGDIIKMVHPKPANHERGALYAWLVEKEYKHKDKDGGSYLLPLISQLEAFRKGESKELPKVPFEMLTSLPLTNDHWKDIARNATFNQVLQNLNTFERHEVLKDPEMVEFIASKISNPDEVRKARLLPYKLLMAFLNANVDNKIKNALQQAMEVAVENVPKIDGDVYVAVDTSGSMKRSITGNRGSATSKGRYIDVASLFASAILRKNKNAVILPFDTQVYSKHEINPFDAIMTNAQKLAKYGGGGTDCASALRHIESLQSNVSAIIMISDNESWRSLGKRSRSTDTMTEWSKIQKRNKNARFVNIDISPSDTSQTCDHEGVMLVGGFSDAVFDVVAGFSRGEDSSDYWMNTIQEIKL